MARRRVIRPVALSHLARSAALGSLAVWLAVTLGYVVFLSLRKPTQEAILGGASSTRAALSRLLVERQQLEQHPQGTKTLEHEAALAGFKRSHPDLNAAGASGTGGGSSSPSRVSEAQLQERHSGLAPRVSGDQLHGSWKLSQEVW